MHDCDILVFQSYKNYQYHPSLISLNFFSHKVFDKAMLTLSCIVAALLLQLEFVTLHVPEN